MTKEIPDTPKVTRPRKMNIAAIDTVHSGLPPRVSALDTGNPKMTVEMECVDRVRKKGIAVVFVTHNVRPAMANGSRLTVLNRSKTLDTAKRSEVTTDKLQDIMADGQEMTVLEGSLGGTILACFGTRVL